MSADDIGLAITMAKVAQTLGEVTDLEGMLQRVTRSACDTIPGADMASISIRHSDGRLETLAPTDDIPAEADALQYEYQEGPCYEALNDDKTVSSPDVATDARWPRYGRAAADLGVKSQLALEFYDSSQSRGALNLYSRSPGALVDQHQLVELFATHAGLAMGHVRTVGGLLVALGTRKVIGQAIGITMERYGIDEQRAFEFLIRVSQSENVKLRDVAVGVVSGEPSNSEETRTPRANGH